MANFLDQLDTLISSLDFNVLIPNDERRYYIDVYYYDYYNDGNRKFITLDPDQEKTALEAKLMKMLKSYENSSSMKTIDMVNLQGLQDHMQNNLQKEIADILPEFETYLKQSIYTYKLGKLPTYEIGVSDITETIRIGVANILGEIKEIISLNQENVTLYVTRHPKFRHFILAYNPDFVMKAIIETIGKIRKVSPSIPIKEIVDKTIYYFIAHESAHILFGHLSGTPEYDTLFGRGQSNYTFDAYINNMLSDMLAITTPDSGVTNTSYVRYLATKDPNTIEIRLRNDRTVDDKLLGLHAQMPFRGIAQLVEQMSSFMMEKGWIKTIKKIKPTPVLAIGDFVKTAKGEVAMVIAIGAPDDTGNQNLKISVKAAKLVLEARRRVATGALPEIALSLPLDQLQLALNALPKPLNGSVL